jgi:RHS repeat-associated protein
VWYLTDYQHSVIGMVDSTGSSLGSLTYDGFGNVLTNTTGVNGDRYGFTSRELDSVTGLQYNWARYYDPALGKWTSMDPLGFDAGDANLYRYVANGPTNGVDPSGRDPGAPTNLNYFIQSQLAQKGTANVSATDWCSCKGVNGIYPSSSFADTMTDQVGCYGLYQCRLGLAIPWRNKCFFTFGEAESYLLDLLRKGATARIFAFQFNPTNEAWLWMALNGCPETPAHHMHLGPGSLPWNYCTYHKPEGERPYWEWMNKPAYRGGCVKYGWSPPGTSVYQVTLYCVRIIYLWSDSKPRPSPNGGKPLDPILQYPQLLPECHYPFLKK